MIYNHHKDNEAFIIKSTLFIVLGILVLSPLCALIMSLLKKHL